MELTRKFNEIIAFLILSVCVIVPFGNDVFISGLPQISKLFHTDKTALVLSAYLLGLAVSQLIYGPLLDHGVRKICIFIINIAFLLILICTHFITA